MKVEGAEGVEEEDDKGKKGKGKGKGKGAEEEEVKVEDVLLGTFEKAMEYAKGWGKDAFVVKVEEEEEGEEGTEVDEAEKAKKEADKERSRKLHESVWYESELLMTRLQRLYDCGLAACSKVEGLSVKCYDEIEESIGVRMKGELEAIERLVGCALDKIEKEESIEYYFDLQSLEFKIDTGRRIEPEAEPEPEPVITEWGTVKFNEEQIAGVCSLLGGEEGEVDVEEGSDILSGIGNDGNALPAKWAAMGYNEWYTLLLEVGGEVGGTVRVSNVLQVFRDAVE
jgi:hypothetical protein